jgi:hypothetical protein
MGPLVRKIQHLCPCDTAVAWLGQRRNAQKAWDECHRAFWMLWLLKREYNITAEKHDKITCVQATCATHLERGIKNGHELADIVRYHFPNPPRRLQRGQSHNAR